MSDEPTLEPTHPPAATGPKRRYLLSIFLTLITTGLGHVYLGRARRGLALHGMNYFFGTLAIAFLLYLPVEPVNALIPAALMVGFMLYCQVDAIRLTRRQNHKPLKRYQRWWVYLGLFIATAVMPYMYRAVIVTVWAEGYVIPTPSMHETILAGDRLLIEKRFFFKRPIRHGDVLMFYREDEFGGNMYLKRAIGLPGDVIEFKDEKLIRNEILIDESYAKFEGERPIIERRMIDIAPFIVPDGHLFMVGDNRRRSHDSRIIGPVPIENAQGHAMAVYFSVVPDMPDHWHADPRTIGIDDDNPSGKIRWNRIGNRLIDSHD